MGQPTYVYEGKIERGPSDEVTAARKLILRWKPRRQPLAAD